jgi:hypothetical protein
MEYIHRPLNTEVTAIGGHYHLVKEARLKHGRRDVLYLVGHAAFETTCCGVGGCAYAVVPGYVLNWKEDSGPEGLPISEVEPINHPADQDAIRQYLLKSELVHQVIFL